MSDDDSSVCDGDYIPQLPNRKQFICFQISPHDDNISKELILDYFISQNYSAIIGEEYGSLNNERHFHILLGTDLDLLKSKVRSKLLYQPLKEIMNTPEELAKKGNVIFRWDKKFKDNYGIYSLKDGDWVSTDDFRETAFYWQTLSYPKPLGLKKDKALLLEKFHQDCKPFPQLVEPLYNGICEIYEKYDTGYDYSSIDKIVLCARNKKHPELREADVKQKVQKFLKHP